MRDILDLPVVHIDLIHYKPGWVERDGAEKDRLCHEVHARQQWIFEGGRSSTWAEGLHRADTLIWLDFPLPIRAWRVVRRTLQHYGKTRPDLPENCPERFTLEFTMWIWNTRNSARVRMQNLYNSATLATDTHRLCNRHEVKAYLQELSNSTQTKSNKAIP